MKKESPQTADRAPLEFGSTTVGGHRDVHAIQRDLRAPMVSPTLPDPFHTRPSGSAIWAIRSQHIAEFQTCVFPSCTRMRACLHNSRSTPPYACCKPSGSVEMCTSFRNAINRSPSARPSSIAHTHLHVVRGQSKGDINGSPCSPPSPCSMWCTVPSSNRTVCRMT